MASNYLLSDDDDDEICPSIGVTSFDFRKDSRALQSTLQDVWTSGYLSDITLGARGQRIQAHRLVLLAHCRGLREDIQAQMDHPQPHIDLDVHPDVLRNILSYVYCHDISISQDDLEAVAEVACRLGVEDLVRSCRNAQLMSKTVTPSNCLQVWMEAEDTGNDSVIKKAMHVALDNFQQVKKTADFKALPPSILKMYVCHADLKVRSPEERLGSALMWARVDSESRVSILEQVLDRLPMRDISTWYLEQLLEDPLVHDNPQLALKINAFLGNVAEEDIRVTQSVQELSVSQVPSKETCLVFVGAVLDGVGRSANVSAIRMEKNYEVVKLGELKGAEFPDGRLFYSFTNCCVGRQDDLYTAGLGARADEIWHFSMANRSYRQCGRLNTGRERHGMAVDTTGRLHIFGGKQLSAVFGGTVVSIETLDPGQSRAVETGQVKHGSSVRQFVLHLDKGDKILYFGGYSPDDGNILQVYDCRSMSVIQTTRFMVPAKIGKGATVYGAVLIKDHVIVVTKHYTGVVKLDDVLNGQGHSFKVCQNYLTPNFVCAVVSSIDGGDLMLLGGKPRSGRPDCFAYVAKVDDVLCDQMSGWQPASIPWRLGKCMFHGGYDIAKISLSA